VCGDTQANWSADEKVMDALGDVVKAACKNDLACITPFLPGLIGKSGGRGMLVTAFAAGKMAGLMSIAKELL
jgi:hypothetical protein